MLLQDAQSLYQYASQPVPDSDGQLMITTDSDMGHSQHHHDHNDMMMMNPSLSDKDLGLGMGGHDGNSLSMSMPPLPSTDLNLSLPLPSDSELHGGTDLEHQTSFLFDSSAFSPTDGSIGLTPRSHRGSSSSSDIMTTTATTTGIKSMQLQDGISSHDKRLTPFDQAASAINNNWNHAAASSDIDPSTSLDSLAYASVLAHTDEEEREAAATLQRMTTPDYETMMGIGGLDRDSRDREGRLPVSGGGSGLSGSGRGSSSGGGTSDLLMGYAPLSQNHAGGELRRMASITGYLDDAGLALSRGDRYVCFVMISSLISFHVMIVII